MPLDQAREYLARVLPWPGDDEATAWVNVHWTFIPKDLQPGRKPPWTGRAVRTVAEAAKAIEFALKSKDTRDIYVCLSTQREAQETRNAKDTFTYHKPVRLAENAVGLKALWLDIDVKAPVAGQEINGYPTTPEAIAAVSKFIVDAGLPKPSMIVGSGGGMHFYWVMNRALTPLEWYPLAAALRNAAEKLGLKFDAAVTTDAARVLRVPETWNHKTNPPRATKILAKTDFDYTVTKLEGILAPYKIEGALPEHLVGYAPHLERRVPLKGESDLAGGIITAMPQDEVRACLDAIPNIAPDWNSWNTVGMRVFAACEGAAYGLEEWRRWSDQLATDGTDSCDARWETLQSSPPTRTGAGALVTAARAALNDPTWRPATVVPVTPVTWVTGGSGVAQSVVASLPSSGLSGGVQVVSAPDPHLPKGYSRDARGIVWLVGLDDNGTTTRTPISDYPMMEAWLQRDPRLLHFLTTTERGREQQISVPLEIVGTNDMRKFLQGQGFMLSANPKLTTEFFLSWIQKLQESKDTVNSTPFGWEAEGGKIKGFVYGGKMFCRTEDLVATNPDRILQRQYGPTGDLDPWKEAAQLVTSQGRPDVEAILASAFAAPIAMLTGHKGLLMSPWSQESGIGKTTAMTVAQSVWGDPARAMQGLTDTQNSMFNKLGQLRSLPLYWDEVKGEESLRKVVDLVFRLSGGVERSRLNQQIKLREAGTWQTVMVVASNDSLVDYVVNQTSTTTAGLYRVFEFEVKPGTKGQISSSAATRLVAKLNNNFGQAGLVYSEFLGRNIDRIDKEVGEYGLALETKVAVKQEERLWTGMITAVVLGARYANETGLTTIDEPALEEFMIQVLERMRRERDSHPVDMKIAMNVSDKLAQFLNAMRHRHTLVTNRIHISPGKPKPGSIKVMGDASHLDGIYVHVGQDDKLLRISSTYLSEWMTAKKYSRSIFTRALAEEFGCKKVHGRIASGTQYAGATEYLLEIDLAGSPLANFIEEA